MVRIRSAVAVARPLAADGEDVQDHHVLEWKL